MESYHNEWIITVMSYPYGKNIPATSAEVDVANWRWYVEVFLLKQKLE